MHTFINSPLQIGSLTIPHRLIQGPLAGYSCAPFRELFTQFTPPAYAVTEMLSANDTLQKHKANSRFLYRSPNENLLAYQLSGTTPQVMAEAAHRLQDLGADLIDINCGCPKEKIRKKGAGSALLETPEKLISIVQSMRRILSIPLTVKIRLQGSEQDIVLAKQIEQAGADALIVHGRRWIDEYDIPCNFQQIRSVKQAVSIPVIANGDIKHRESLIYAIKESECDGFMIARGGCGRPWLYQELLAGEPLSLSLNQKETLFMTHLTGLAALEDEFKAVLQSKSLVRYYFREEMGRDELVRFYSLNTLADIKQFLSMLINSAPHPHSVFAQ